MEDNQVNKAQMPGQKSTIFKYTIKEGHRISKILNSSKDKITIKLYMKGEEKSVYSKEYTYKEIVDTSPIFAIENNLEGIDRLINESINNFGENISLSEENEEDKINLIIPIKINSKMREIKFELEKSDLSEEETISLLVDNLNELLVERRQVLGEKSLDEISSEKLGFNKNELSDKIKELSKKADENSKLFDTFVKSNLYLLSNSNIIKNEDDAEFICKKLKQIDKEINKKLNKDNKNFKAKENDFIFKLVYRGTRDGDSATVFHKRCDKIGQNITLVKTDKDKIFGGFTKCNWEIPEEYLKEIEEDDTESGIQKNDEYSFCFTLGSEKKIYNHCDESDEEVKPAIFCGPKFGPTFCNNIFAINNKFLKYGGYSTKNEKSCFDGQENDYELTGEKNFKIKELEVYEIITLKRV